MQNATFDIQEKEVPPMLVAGVRMRGRYQECGSGFGKIGRRCGRHICGKPLMLIYDDQYKEDDADFEACMPIRKGESTAEICVRELPGGKFLTLLHQGPYEDLGRSYAKILEAAIERGCEIGLPTREVFLKGPGMIFKGNPKKYLTEIQLPIET